MFKSYRQWQIHQSTYLDTIEPRLISLWIVDDQPMDLPEPLIGLLSHGLLGILVLATVEKLIPIIPSYVLYVFLGMVIPGHWFDLGLTIAVSVAGSLLAGFAWYGVGRVVGEHRIEAIVERYGRYVLLKLSVFDRLRRAYRHNDMWVTAIGHMVPVVRFYLPIPAGVLALPWGRFLIASGIGCLVWNGTLLTLGFILAGTGRPALQIGLSAILALLTIELLIGLYYRHRQRHRQARLDEVACLPDCPIDQK